MADDLPELSAEAEALLADWPVAHRRELDWDNFAAETVARAWADDADVDPALLLAPALEPEAGEPSVRAQEPRTTPRPSRPEPEFSLKDLAIASLAEAKAAESADIAQQALSTSRLERVSRPSFHDIPRTSEIRAAKSDLRLAPNAPGDEADAALAPEPSPAAPAPSAAQPAATAQGAPRGKIVLAAVLGLAAAAACLMLLQGPRGGAPVAQAPTEATPSPEATTVAAPKQPAPPTGLTVEPLVAEAPTPPVPRGLGGAPSLTGGGPRVATLPAKPAAEPAATASPAATEEPDDPRLVPAAKPESVPLEPSTGAALAAVGRVMGGAKACVAGHGASSTATLTFASSGKVQSVSVGPPAAGTSAESCIRSALSGARVAPFAKPSFTIRVPIRP